MGDLDEFFFCSDDSSLGPGKESSDFPQPPTDHSDPTAPAAQQAANPGGASSAALGGQLSDQPGTVTPAPIPGRLTLLPGMAQTSSSSSPQHATTTAAGVCVVGGATHGSGRPVTSLCVDTHLPIDTYSPRELDAEAEQLDAKVQLRDGSCSQLLLTLHSPATIPYREVSTLRARRSNTRGTTLLTPRSAAAAPPHSPGPLSPTATLPLAALSASVPDTPPSPTSPDPPSSSPASAPNTPPPPPSPDPPAVSPASAPNTPPPPPSPDPPAVSPASAPNTPPSRVRAVTCLDPTDQRLAGPGPVTRPQPLTAADATPVAVEQGLLLASEMCGSDQADEPGYGTPVQAQRQPVASPVSSRGAHLGNDIFADVVSCVTSSPVYHDTPTPGRKSVPGRGGPLGGTPTGKAAWSHAYNADQDVSRGSDQHSMQSLAQLAAGLIAAQAHPPQPVSQQPVVVAAFHTYDTNADSPVSPKAPTPRATADHGRDTSPAPRQPINTRTLPLRTAAPVPISYTASCGYQQQPSASNPCTHVPSGSCTQCPTLISTITTTAAAAAAGTAAAGDRPYPGSSSSRQANDGAHAVTCGHRPQPRRPGQRGGTALYPNPPLESSDSPVVRDRPLTSRFDPTPRGTTTATATAAATPPVVQTTDSANPSPDPKQEHRLDSPVSSSASSPRACSPPPCLQHDTSPPAATSGVQQLAPGGCAGLGGSTAPSVAVPFVPPTAQLSDPSPQTLASVPDHKPASRAAFKTIAHLLLKVLPFFRSAYTSDSLELELDHANNALQATLSLDPRELQRSYHAEAADRSSSAARSARSTSGLLHSRVQQQQQPDQSHSLLESQPDSWQLSGERAMYGIDEDLDPGILSYEQGLAGGSALTGPILRGVQQPGRAVHRRGYSEVTDASMSLTAQAVLDMGLGGGFNSYESTPPGGDHAALGVAESSVDGQIPQGLRGGVGGSVAAAGAHNLHTAAATLDTAPLEHRSSMHSEDNHHQQADEGGGSGMGTSGNGAEQGPGGGVLSVDSVDSSSGHSQLTNPAPDPFAVPGDEPPELGEPPTTRTPRVAAQRHSQEEGTGGLCPGAEPGRERRCGGVPDPRHAGGAGWREWGAGQGVAAAAGSGPQPQGG
ncbi:MAG: hypothetical protein WDW38_010836 [Sanguina aurantia]